MRECEAEDGDDQDSGRRGTGDLSPAPEQACCGQWLRPLGNAATVVAELG
jgi:hypothetical protein